jgi:hypothetical protein
MCIAELATAQESTNFWLSGQALAGAQFAENTSKKLISKIRRMGSPGGLTIELRGAGDWRPVCHRKLGDRTLGPFE